MKRSDMITLLLQENIARRKCIQESEESRISALLECLERLGMSPPAYLPEPIYHESTGKQLPNLSINEWEKE